MINFLRSMLALFPDNIEPFIDIAFTVFIVFTVISILMVAVNVIKDVVGIFTGGH